MTDVSLDVEAVIEEVAEALCPVMSNGLCEYRRTCANCDCFGSPDRPGGDSSAYVRQFAEIAVKVTIDTILLLAPRPVRDLTLPEPKENP